MTTDAPDFGKLRFQVRLLGTTTVVLAATTLYFALNSPDAPSLGAIPPPAPTVANNPAHQVDPHATTAPVEPEIQRLYLMGSVVDSDPSQSKVWIRDDRTGQVGRYGIGDELPDGRHVRSIGTDHVEISGQDDQSRLPLQAAPPDAPTRDIPPTGTQFSFRPLTEAPAGTGGPPPGSSGEAPAPSGNPSFRIPGARRLSDGDDFPAELEQFMRDGEQAEAEIASEDLNP